MYMLCMCFHMHVGVLHCFILQQALLLLLWSVCFFSQMSISSLTVFCFALQTTSHTKNVRILGHTVYSLEVWKWPLYICLFFCRLQPTENPCLHPPIAAGEKGLLQSHCLVYLVRATVEKLNCNMVDIHLLPLLWKTHSKVTKSAQVVFKRTKYYILSLIH